MTRTHAQYFVLGLLSIGQMGPCEVLKIYPNDDVVTLTIVIGDPEKTPNFEFYEDYGILFEPDARDDGPICVARVNSIAVIDSNIERRCILLSELRRVIWHQNP